MNWLRRFKFGARLGLLLAAFSIGFLVYGAWTYYATQKVSVGGPLYQRIELSQQLVSDVLPPPEFIVESYLTCVQISSAVSGYKQGLLIDRVRQLQKEYEQRHQYWLHAGLPPDLARVLLQQAHEPAMAFYDKVDREFLPAIFLNDRVTSERVLADMTKLYEAHRLAIDAVVARAQRSALDNEASALAAVQTGRRWQVGILMVLFGVVAGLAMLIHRSILQPLTQAVAIANQVAGGQ
jgi:methyl-accepting chemotaxis protein